MNSIILQVRLVLFLILAFTCISTSKNIEGYMDVDGIERFYIIHLPENADLKNPLPVVLILHGGGGNAKHMMKFSGFNNTADKEFFIAVYPEGYEKNWSDGRIGDKLPMKRDDVKFISMLLDTMIVKYSIDTKRIFTTGISNGGFFSIYLALKLSGRILAIAPICASIPENLKDSFIPENPISVMLINGTDDKLVKYEGGHVGFNDWDRGESISTDETIKIWVKNNKCSSTPVEEKMPDTNKKDDCKATRYNYSGGLSNSEVVLIKIDGGGHTWPGGTQYLPKFIVGNVCKDFLANNVVWEFFKNQKSRE